MKAVEIQELHHTYPDGTAALRGVSLAVEAGSRTVILGANGSGKSTLLLHLNGLLTCQKGTVKVVGLPVNKETCARIRKRVGFVFQDPDDQLFATSVAEDVAFGPRNQGLNEQEVARRVEEALTLTGISALAAKPPHLLSLGQKKRAAIAGVLAQNPEVLVMDEPTASLDPTGVQQLMQLLAELHAAGKTIIMATHDVDTAYAWADQVCILDTGEIMANGSSTLLEDEPVLSRAGLVAPLIRQVFRGTGYNPRNTALANNWLLTRLRINK